eukprot:jgi/Tetstr1/437436/TSEL_026117.t1
MAGGSRSAASTAARLLRAVGAHSAACPCHGCGGLLAGGRGARLLAQQGGGSSGDGGHEYAFEMGVLQHPLRRRRTREVGADLRNLGARHACVVTDPNMATLLPVQRTLEAIEAAGVAYTLFDKVSVEPTDVSLGAAITFARRGGFDAYIAVGGGSSMDTAKVMNLYAAQPDAAFLDFVNAPVGAGLAVPATAPIKPLIAVPTTAGTGSETTGVAIFDHTPLRAKTGIGSRLLKPTLGIVDPNNTAGMPAPIAAASGFDVLCHALEAYTALPYSSRSPRPADPSLRPAYQGSNPISDVWCRETLRLLADNFVAAVKHGDPAAKEQMALAATYAGIGFGNAGVHLCHGMSYPISGLNRSYIHPGYEGAATKLVPHGISVAVPAPAVFRFTAAACPERHLEAARLLGADTTHAKASASHAGGLLAERLTLLMVELDVPLSLRQLGFGQEDVEELVKGTLPQRRVTQLSPHGSPDEDALAMLFEAAM